MRPLSLSRWERRGASTRPSLSALRTVHLGHLITPHGAVPARRLTSLQKAIPTQYEKHPVICLRSHPPHDDRLSCHRRRRTRSRARARSRRSRVNIRARPGDRRACAVSETPSLAGRGPCGGSRNPPSRRVFQITGIDASQLPADGGDEQAEAVEASAVMARWEGELKTEDQTVTSL